MNVAQPIAWPGTLGMAHVKRSAAEWCRVQSGANMTTIRDVAERAGVSTTTVSHVINASRRVDPETAARVRAAIEELKYHPNALARSMRRGQTHTVGVVLPDISNPFFGDLARQLEDDMFEAGYSAIICNTDGDMEKESRYLDVLLSKKVDGLLLIAANQPSDRLRHIIEVGPPTVVVDRALDGLPTSHVVVANHEGGRLAGHHLLALGHRDIGVVAGPGDLGTSDQRLAGFRDALAGAGVAIDDRRVFSGDFRATSGRAALDKWIAEGVVPTAVFAENDLMALGVLSSAHSANLPVPERLSVVGFDGIAFTAESSPPLTTVTHSTAQMASVTVSLLLDQLRDGEASPRSVELPVELLVRGSTASVSPNSTP